MSVARQCRQVVQAKDKTIELKDLAITQCEKTTGDLTHEVEAEKRKADAWYRSPILWSVVGAVAGGYLVSKFK